MPSPRRAATEKEKLLAVTLACRSARLIVTKYIRLMQMHDTSLQNEIISANHVLRQIDDALDEKR